MDAKGGLTQYQYDSAGNLVALTDPVGNISRWTYTALGQVFQEIDPLGKAVTYEYHDNGQVERRTDRLGRIREYVYYDNGRLKDEIWKNPDQTIANVRSFTWFADGQVNTATDSTGSISYTYDGNRRAKRTHHRLANIGAQNGPTVADFPC